MARWLECLPGMHKPQPCIKLVAVVCLSSWNSGCELGRNRGSNLSSDLTVGQPGLQETLPQRKRKGISDKRCVFISLSPLGMDSHQC